ncbi:MAG: hypothetical protein IJK84_10625 [Bacteroidales bacterium]|nr:hypothetical protein [Bacteroidales bacterium]
MKKQIILVAAALLLGMTACQKEENILPINNGSDNYETALVKSVSDLIGTDWTYTYNDTLAIPGYECDSIEGLILNFSFGLSFDSSYAHLTFPENVVAMGIVETSTAGMYDLQEISQMDFAYTYDPTTHTGTLVATVYDYDGSHATYELPFEYDTTTDAITVTFSLAFEGDTENSFPFEMVFHRNV